MIQPMFGLGAPELIIVIVVILLISGAFSAIKNRGIVFLSLTRFIVDPENEDLVVIEGRKTGLIQWFLVQLKLGNTYQIKIKGNQITYCADSAAGKSLSLAPIHRVSSTSCGYQKPIGLLIWGGILAILAIILLFAGEFVAFLITLIVAAILFGLYIYKKNFYISIETTGSSKLGFSFKRSYIENVPIDIEKIESAIVLINDLVIKAK